MQRHLHYGRRCVREQMRLPKLWAGFRPSDVPCIEPGGPELAEHCARTGLSAADAMAAIQRSYFGLLLFPFAWVSSAWPKAATVFADLRRFPLRQVFPITNLPEDLVGFQRAAEYDFLDTRFHSFSSQSRAAETALA